MCGIFFTLNGGNYGAGQSIYAYTLIDRLRHRGPDGTQVLTKYIKDKNQNNNRLIYGFHRLAIINPTSGINQPFQKQNVILLCNGEIYNWRQLAKIFNIKISNDCEIIIELYLYFGRNLMKVMHYLDGEYAFILHDLEKDAIYAARDFMGIRPLYYAVDMDTGYLSIASEMRAIELDSVDHILPRKIYKFGGLTKKVYIDTVEYWEFPKFNAIKKFTTYKDIDEIYGELYRRLFESVNDRLYADREIGCLLSGGLDSSIVAAICAKISANVQYFVIGGEDSPDVIAAKKVADYIGVSLTIVPFDYIEGINNIPKVIQSLETYDITTIRASTPQWHLAKWIKENTNVRVVLSGEGSDELFGGYAYSKLFDEAKDLWLDGEELLSELYLFDCLRTDRAMSAWGLEVRVPFLQIKLVEFIRSIDPNLNLVVLNEKTASIDYGIMRNIEKTILRGMAARFKLLPSDILYRPKEAFSDAVGFKWRDSIHTYVIDKYTYSMDRLINCEDPATLEATLYYDIFENIFPNRKHILPHYWMPKKYNTGDPSARVLPVYHNIAGDNSPELYENTKNSYSVPA